jgi:Asp-tRNA(Asn)/Glu-tRNA(Gln) amidotransferase A subunit family amidase
VVGLKTTFGLVPLAGVMPISARNLDTVGPIAKDVKHTIEGMDLLQRNFAARYRAVAAARPSGRAFRVGRLYVEGTNRAIDEAVDNALAAAGFRVVRLDEGFVRAWEQAIDDGTRVAAVSGWLTDREYLDKRGINGITKSAIKLGQMNYDARYWEALARRPAWQRTLRGVFEEVDLIATPTLRALPPRISPFGRSAFLELRVLGIQNTVAVNFAGNPALAVPVPAGIAKSPLASLQLVAPPRHEAELLRAGQIVENTVWKTPLGQWALAD